MKRRDAVGLFALITALAFPVSGVGFAVEKTEESKQAQVSEPMVPKEAMLKEANGRIASVNPQEKMVKLRRGLLPFFSTQFLVDWRTTIANEETGQRLSLGDLRQGDPVTIEYTAKDGKRIARSITVT